MSIKNKQTWNEIIKFVVTVLTALLGAMGVSSCSFRASPLGFNNEYLVLFDRL